MIRACLLTMLGGFAAQHNRVLLSSDLAGLLLVAACACFFVHRLRALSCISLGFALFVLAANDVVAARLDPELAGDSLLTEVRVSDFVKRDGQFLSFIAAPVADTRLPSRIRIRWLNWTDTPVIGEIWQLKLRLSRPRGSSNPGGYDLEAWMLRENLHASAYVVPGKRNRRLAESTLSPLTVYKAKFVQHAVSNSLSKDAAAVIAAIGVGVRHLLSREQWQHYARTGTSHLMAISGLHVGLAATVSFFLLLMFFGVLRLPGNSLAQALVGGVIMAALYAWVSGFAVPARRATCMLMLGTLALLFRRRVYAGRIIALAAFLVFVIDPLAIMAPGFSLSFAAVIILLWQSHGTLQRRRGKHWATRLLAVLQGLVRMQGVLLLGMLPLTVFYFQRIALLAPAANLLLVPLFSVVIVPLVLLAMLFLPWSESASGSLLRLAAGSIDISESLVRLFANTTIADIAPTSFRGPAIYVLPLCVMWLILPRRWPGRWVAVIALAAVVLQRPANPPTTCFDAHFLDVGQGLAVVVQTNRHTLLFDTGMAYRGGGSAAEQIVLPFLNHLGIQRIDWLIVSHADLDHSGGVTVLREKLAIGQTMVGEALPGINPRTSPCRAGMAWRSAGVAFRVLHPSRGAVGNGNDASCVLEVSAGDHRLLLTGDIEAAAERDLLARKTLQSVDLLLVPHHGSSTSSSAELVDAAKPSLAIVSAGYQNRWGLPKNAVIERWRTSGAQILNTATSGAISARLCEEGGLLRLQEHRARQHRFWRDQTTE